MTKFLSSLKKAASVLPTVMLLATTMQVSAAEISYIHTGHGTGTLDGVAFDSDFAIASFADTDNVTSCGGACLTNDNLVSTIYIESLGVFSFLTPTRYFSNGGMIGFSRAGDEQTDLFNGPAFATWDMISSTGAITGTGSLLQWSLSDVVTTGGTLVFDGAQIGAAFTASVSEVPVPAGAWLFGSGLVGLVGVARRKA